MCRKLAILLVLLGVLLISCDPVRMIIVRAPQKPNHSVTIFGNENITLKANRFPYLYDSLDRKTVIQVPTKDTIPLYELSFAEDRIGTWGNEENVMWYSTFIDSIIITNDSGRLSVNNSKAIKEYLLGHRSGLVKHQIVIEAK